MTTQPATEKQLSYLGVLVTQRDLSGLSSIEAGMAAALGTLSRKSASDLIGRLVSMPKKAGTMHKKPYEQALEVGVYRVTTGSAVEVVRVYKGQQSGMNLVKVVSTNWETGAFSFEYLSSAHQFVSGTSSLGKVLSIESLPISEGAKWGRLTGTCIYCGRKLDDPESVERGIGPVCYKGVS